MASIFRLLKEAGLARHQLILFAVLTAAINGLTTASIGAWLAQTYTSHQSRRHAVEVLADLIYERQTRARMVLSAIRRNADADEIKARKRAYDDAFVEWNKKVQGGVLAIREAMDAADTTQLETLLQTLLVPAMGEMDVCTTRVYDERIAGKDYAPDLEICQRQELNSFILDCGAAITDELYRFTSLNFMPWPRSTANAIQSAKERIVAGCKRPPAIPLTPLPGAAPPAPVPAAPVAQPAKGG